MKPRNCIGQNFGRLTIIKKHSITTNGKILVLCKCICSKQVIVRLQSLVSKTTQSCGCLQKERVRQVLTKHGLTGTRLYRIWKGIKNRIKNKKLSYYKRYGGRGLKLSKKWERSFIEFKKWSINNGYKEDLSIDRIDNNKGYFPSNCRWVDLITQANNKRNNFLITVNGETKTLTQWCRYYDISVQIVHARIRKGGWEPLKALTQPLRRVRRGKLSSPPPLTLF